MMIKILDIEEKYHQNYYENKDDQSGKLVNNWSHDTNIELKRHEDCNSTWGPSIFPM